MRVCAKLNSERNYDRSVRYRTPGMAEVNKKGVSQKICPLARLGGPFNQSFLLPLSSFWINGKSQSGDFFPFR